MIDENTDSLLEKLKPKLFEENDDRTTFIVYNAILRKGLRIASVISFAFLILCILTHIYSWGFQIEVRDVVTVFSASMVAVSAFYAAKSFQLNIDTNQQKLEFDYRKFMIEQNQKKEESIYKSKREYEKKIYSFVLFDKYTSSEMASNMQCARLFCKNEPLFDKLGEISPFDVNALKVWADQFDQHPDRKSIIYVLNYFEQVGLALHHDLADENVVKDYLKSVILKNYNDYRSYIKYRQNYESQTFLEHLEKLIHKWNH